MTQPKLSYTIWFSQRTGSTLLGEALASTGVAGNPAEWLHFQSNDPLTMTREDIEQKWQHGTTPNGVFGIMDRRVSHLVRAPGACYSRRSMGYRLPELLQAYLYDAPQQSQTGCLLVACDCIR
ncbi:Stf0 sulphotransferase [Paenibacillus sp. OV219]|nr:Stf0 sulphotransferase [Paenibacillus sp. OV219]